MINVNVDWLANGTFTDFGDDVSPDVLKQGRVAIQYGREPGPEASTTAGSGGMTLNNRSRRYSSRNTASPLYGKIKPARPVKITRTVGGTTYTLFRGHTDETPLNPESSARTVSPTLVDYLSDFRGQTISTPMYRGIRTGEAIGYVLDAVGWTGGRDLDAGATVIPWWWEDNTDALSAIDKIVRSEGFPALVTMGSNNEVIFRDRFHRYIRAASSTSQGTWRSVGTIEPVMNTGFTYDDAWQNIVNQAGVEVETRRAGLPAVIWESEGPIEMVPGTTRIITASTTDPFIDASIEYTLAGDDDTKPWALRPLFNGDTSLSRTSGGSTDLLIDCTNPHFSPRPLVYRLESVRIVAKPVPVASTQLISASDATSKTTYGTRTPTSLDIPWGTPGDAQAILNRMVADRKDPLPVVTARFVVGRVPAKITNLLPRNLGDRVTIQEPETFLNDAFHIEQIRHDFGGEEDHEVTFSLERVPPTVPPNLFVLGTSVLNTGMIA